MKNAEEKFVFVLSSFMNDRDFKLCKGKSVDWIMEHYTEKHIDTINEVTGGENVPRYWAYVVQYLTN